MNAMKENQIKSWELSIASLLISKCFHRVYIAAAAAAKKVPLNGNY
jgi:hypothetical protein